MKPVLQALCPGKGFRLFSMRGRNHVVRNIDPDNRISGQGIRLLGIGGGKNHVAKNIDPHPCVCNRGVHLHCHPVGRPYRLQIIQENEGREINRDNFNEAMN